MCGIVGIFLKDAALEPELGRMTAGMLAVLSDRGPDSAGFAVYGQAEPGLAKITLRLADGIDAVALVENVSARAGAEIRLERRADHAVLRLADADAQAVLAVLAGMADTVRVVASGHSMELYKGVGLPEHVTARFGLAEMRGTHAIGHTRMATESAVTVAGAHPFSTGPDQCLVHNGSLSNHNSVRRMLAREGFATETENDTEVAAAYLSWRLHQGARLDAALKAALADLDGFYTFVVGTKSGFAVLRDRVACKPAVMAETARYVAFGSEYRAMVDLPGIETATLFEPEPATVYFWERDAAARGAMSLAA